MVEPLVAGLGLVVVLARVRTVRFDVAGSDEAVTDPNYQAPLVVGALDIDDDPRAMRVFWGVTALVMLGWGGAFLKAGLL